MKRKNKLFILTDDLEKLNDRYAALHKKIKNAEEISEAHSNRMAEVLLEKYNFEIEELSAAREVEYYTQQAEIKAKNAEQIPWRRCWLWRLLFQPLTNRAQDIIEEEAALEAEELFTNSENELKILAKNTYGENGSKLSKRKRKKALMKYLKFKRLLEGEPAEPQKPEKLELKQPDEKTEPKTVKKTPKSNNQLQGQMTLDDVQSPTPRADERKHTKKSK